MKFNKLNSALKEKNLEERAGIKNLSGKELYELEKDVVFGEAEELLSTEEDEAEVKVDDEKESEEESEEDESEEE
jgi:hypothetical protein